MKKGRDFLGLPIIDPATGERLGEVVDLVMESAHQEVSGLLIDKGNWLHLPKQMLTSTIQTVQTDAIKVHTPECVTAKHVCLASTLQGRKVKTVGGKLLGTVQDILLDEYSWKITGLEISDGFLSDIVTGRAVIHQPSIVTQSEHAVVVEDKLEKLWETQRN